MHPVAITRTISESFIDPNLTYEEIFEECIQKQDEEFPRMVSAEPILSASLHRADLFIWRRS